MVLDWSPLAPLLEVEGNPVTAALLEEIEEPPGVAEAGVGAAFATGDYPLNVAIGKPGIQFDRSEQGLA